MKSYVPKRGDLVWLSFSPQAGHEQTGRRPGIVISPESYNKRTGLALLCPITNQKKGYPFEVELFDTSVTGVILSDQIRSLDWKSRPAEFIGRVSPETLEEVLAKILPLISEEE